MGFEGPDAKKGFMDFRIPRYISDGEARVGDRIKEEGLRRSDAIKAGGEEVVKIPTNVIRDFLSPTDFAAYIIGKSFNSISLSF